VHVFDLADTHALRLKCILKDKVSRIFSLAEENAFSTCELVDKVEYVLNSQYSLKKA